MRALVLTLILLITTLLSACSTTKNQPARSPCVSNEYSEYKSPCGDRTPLNTSIT